MAYPVPAPVGPHRFDPSYVFWSRCAACGKHRLNPIHTARG